MTRKLKVAIVAASIALLGAGCEGKPLDRCPQNPDKCPGATPSPTKSK